LLLIFLTGFNRPSQAQDYAITVSAGGFDRVESMVSATFPKPVAPGVYQLKDASDNTILMQVNGHNRGWCIVDKLPAGTSKTYTSSPEASATSATHTGITYDFDQDTVTFQKEEHSVFSYYYRSNDPPEELGPIYKRAGYIHPLFSPNEVPLTNHLDLKMHSHHYGIWAAWPNTKFQAEQPNFGTIENGWARFDTADPLQTIW